MSSKNSKMTNCKSCGTEIAKSAKSCPKCGAKQGGIVKTIKKMVLFFIGGVVLFFVIAFIGMSLDKDYVPVSERDKEPVESTETGDETSASESETGEGETGDSASESDKNTFSVGETATFNDISVTYVDITESKRNGALTPAKGNVYLTCEFEIENNSDHEIPIGVTLFDAYADDYSAKFSETPFLGSDKQKLWGHSVDAGKKLRGVVGYEVSKDWSKFELISAPDFWFDMENGVQREIVFVHNK
ncbi:MAG: DUF4352 domain-containing protein [Clostridiaceae bacterium]|nr:DUF4352 domain-containing protein [Clostridiaceae bacterium]